MNQLISRIYIAMNKRNWRKTPYIQTKGIIETKMFYEDYAS